MCAVGWGAFKEEETAGAEVLWLKQGWALPREAGMAGVPQAKWRRARKTMGMAEDFASG